MEVEEGDDLPGKDREAEGHVARLLYPGLARGTEGVDEGEGGGKLDIPDGEIGADTSLGTCYLVPFLRMR